AFAVALLSKENAITFLMLPPLYDVCFSQNRTTASLSSLARKRLPSYAGYAVVAVLFLIARHAVIKVDSVSYIPNQYNPLDHLSIIGRALGATAMVGRYAKLFLFPRTLSYDYGLGAIPSAVSILDPFFVAGLLCLGLILVALIWGWHRSPCT